MFDVVSLGEAVIDFSMCGKGPMNNPAFEMNPGGAGCNLIVPTAMLGAKVASIGKIGDDLFGDYVIDYLAKRNINTDGIRKTPDYSTCISFVSIDEDGDREFSFVKGTGMKKTITMDDIDLSIVDQAKMFATEGCHIVNSVGYKTIFELIDHVKSKGIDFAFDCNYRPNLFPDKDEAREYMMGYVMKADYIKASEIEMSILTGYSEPEYEKGLDAMMKLGNKKGVFITIGAKGAYYAVKGCGSGYVEGFKVNAVDTTGCGDAFLGTMLYYLTNSEGLEMREMVRRANAVGALCAMKPGGIGAMPTKPEFEAFLSAHSN